MPDEPRTGPTIEDYLLENRTFPPSPPFQAQALVAGPLALRRGRRRLRGVLGPPGPRAVTWSETSTSTVRVGPAVRQVVRGRHAQRLLQLPRPPRRRRPRGDKVAYPLGGRARRHPDHHLRRAARRGRAVRQRAARASGVERGDRVAIYMPMIPELPVAMLACTRIGAAHSVVFGGFSPDALRDRINDAEAKVLITADGGWRRGRGGRRSRPNADAAVAETPRRSSTWWWRGAPATPATAPPPMTEGRDHWWHDLMAGGRGRRARPSTWTPRTCSTCSTPRAPRPSPRASCTPPAAT